MPFSGLLIFYEYILEIDFLQGKLTGYFPNFAHHYCWVKVGKVIEYSFLLISPSPPVYNIGAEKEGIISFLFPTQPFACDIMIV